MCPEFQACALGQEYPEPIFMPEVPSICTGQQCALLWRAECACDRHACTCEQHACTSDQRACSQCFWPNEHAWSSARELHLTYHLPGTLNYLTMALQHTKFNQQSSNTLNVIILHYLHFLFNYSLFLELLKMVKKNKSSSGCCRGASTSSFLRHTAISYATFSEYLHYVLKRKLRLLHEVYPGNHW